MEIPVVVPSDACPNTSSGRIEIDEMNSSTVALVAKPKNCHKRVYAICIDFTLLTIVMNQNIKEMTDKHDLPVNERGFKPALSLASCTLSSTACHASVNTYAHQSAVIKAQSSISPNTLTIICNKNGGGIFSAKC